MNTLNEVSVARTLNQTCRNEQLIAFLMGLTIEMWIDGNEKVMVVA